MASPAYLLTGSFSSLTGNSTGYVKILLAGYGQQIPRVAGTGVLAPLSYTSVVGASFSVILYGNDQISPASTYYLVSLYDAAGNPVFSNAQYQLTGSGGDLSSITPSASAPLPIPIPSAVPAGTFLAGPPSGASGPPVYRTIKASDILGTSTQLNIQNYGTNVGIAHGIRLGASMTSGSATLTIAAAPTAPYPFTPGDVNSLAKVAGAGANGSDLYATISAYISSTQVTLNANAGTSVSSATAAWWVSGQDTIDTNAKNAQLAAADALHGIAYDPAAFYLYSSTPSWGSSFQTMLGDGIRSTIWLASNANAGSFYAPSGTAPRWETLAKFSVYGPGKINASLITNVALASNILTVTVNNNFTAGQTVVTQLMVTANGKLLNNLVFVVATASSTQFTASYTHADIPSTADTGIAYVQESAFLINSGGLWFGRLEELEVYGFQGNGIQMTKPILNNWSRIWVHNCGAMGYNFFVQQPTAVGATGTTLATCYANGCYGPGFFMYYWQEGTLLGCYSEQNGGGYIFDFCQGLVMNGCAAEQITYQNATLPGKYIEFRTCRNVVWNGGFLINDSGGNAAQTYIAFNTNGTIGSACQQNSVNNCYITTSGSRPTLEVSFEDATCIYNRVVEPFNTFGTLNVNDSGGVNSNNSIVYKGSEKAQGQHDITITANAGNSAVIIQTPTAATVSANANSPAIEFQANYWNGSASAADSWKIRANTSSGSSPIITLDFTHSGSSGGGQITVNGTAVINNSAQWIGGINTSSAVTVGGVTCTTITASGLILANGNLRQGTPQVQLSPAVVAGNFVLGAGWGASPTGPTVQASSFNAAGRLSVVPGGAGIVANPTMTFTYTADTNSGTPNIQLQDESTNVLDTGQWSITSINATVATITYKGTPVSGRTYAFSWQMVFRN